MGGTREQPAASWVRGWRLERHVGVSDEVCDLLLMPGKVARAGSLRPMPKKALHDVDVHAAADGLGGEGVTPAMREVTSWHLGANLVEEREQDRPQWRWDHHDPCARSVADHERLLGRQVEAIPTQGA